MIEGARQGVVIAIRVDAGGNFGLGHLSRSLAIAGELRKAGSEPLLLTRSGLSAERAAALNVPVVLVDREEDEVSVFQRAAVDHGARLLVIDNKEVTGAALERPGIPVVVIDPVLSQLSAAALAIIPTAHADEGFLARARQLAGRVEYGAPFVIVRDEIRAAGSSGPAESDVPTLVVTTGGSDPAGVLFTLLSELARLPEEVCRLRILRGSAFVHSGRLDVELGTFGRAVEVLTDEARFPRALAESDVALCTFGVTPYELAHLGVPAVIISHSDENAEGAARFCRHGSALDLGHMEVLAPRAVSSAVQALLVDKARQAQMRLVGRALIDGLGAERVAGSICRELEGVLAAP